MMMIFILCTYHSLMLARGLINSLTSGCAWSRELYPCENSDLPVKHDSVCVCMCVCVCVSSRLEESSPQNTSKIYKFYIHNIHIFNIIFIIKIIYNNIYIYKFIYLILKTKFLAAPAFAECVLTICFQTLLNFLQQILLPQTSRLGGGP
jgi:hypothetical protein